MSFCTECGARLGAQARFCTECGTGLGATHEPHIQKAVIRPDSAGAGASGASDGKAVPQVTAEVPPWRDPSSPGASEPSIAQAGTHQQNAPEASGAWVQQITSKLGILPQAQTTAAAKDGLLALTVIAGVLLAAVALAAGIFAPEGHHGSPTDWLRTAVIILGLGVHAPAELHVVAATGQGLTGTGTFVVAATFTPLIVTAFVGFGCFWFARRTERRLGSQSIKAAAMASLLTGAVFAGVAALVALLSSGMPGFGLTNSSSYRISTTASLGANPWWLLLAAFALSAACTFAGRATALSQSRGLTLSQLATTRVTPWLADMRTAKNMILGAAAVTALGIVCVVGWIGIHALLTSDPSSAASVSAADVPGPGAKNVVGTVVGLALLLPNLIVAGVGFALGGTLGFSGSGSAESSLLGSAPWVGNLNNGIGFLTGGVPTTAYLILLPMLIMALALGVRAVVQRAPDEPYGPHVWRTSALFAAFWVLPAFLVQVTGSISGNAAALGQSGDAVGSAVVGLGMPSILIAALLWGVVAAFGGAQLARFVAASLPRPISWLGGSDINPDWELLLADAVMVRGGPMPDRLAAAADRVRTGARPQARQLDVSPGRDRLLALGGASLVAVVLAGTVGYQVVQDNVYGPNVVVGQYFSAVASHDVPGALQLLDASTSKNLDKSLLTTVAMSKVPSNVSVGSTTVTGDRAVVMVNETLDGAPTQASFTLNREGSAGGIFDAWRLDAPFTQLTISTNNAAASSSLTVNGVAVSADVHPVFPGVYTVAQPQVGLYQASNTQVTSTGEGTQTATLSNLLDPSVQQAADLAVRAMLDTCATSTDPTPTSCPFSYDNSATFNTPTSVQWTITSYPTVSVDVASDGTLSLTTTSAGTAHISALSTDYAGTVTPVSQDPTITLSGTLNWNGGDPSTASVTLN